MNKANCEEGGFMLRELPENELPDYSDYECWYFVGQRTEWEAESTEAHTAREQRKTAQALFLSRRQEKRDDTLSSSTYHLDVPPLCSETSILNHTRRA